MRFGPVRTQRTDDAAVQIIAEERGMSDADIRKFANVKVEWEKYHKQEAEEKAYTNYQILRFTIFCNFHLRNTISLMKRTNPRHFTLTASSMVDQLQSRTIFPCPGLKTREGHNCIYMRPSRFCPDETPVADIIDSLIFVMDRTIQQDPNRPLAFIANMTGWKMRNFSYQYCRSFMSVLQGITFPGKVGLFLIMNPPSWFGKVWTIMKPMLSSSFRSKVRFIKDKELIYLMDLDFEEYLPNEVLGGEVNTAKLCRDFVKFHTTLERETQKKRTIFRQKKSTEKTRRLSWVIPRSFKRKRKSQQAAKEEGSSASPAALPSSNEETSSSTSFTQSSYRSTTQQMLPSQ